MFFDFKRNRDWAEHLTFVMQVGLTIAGCVVFCFFVGRYLDRWLGTKGIFLIIFTLFGVIGGANVAYRQILKVLEEEKENKKSSNNGRD